MSGMRVIGIDPGPTPGIVVLQLEDRLDGGASGAGTWLERTDVVQCSQDVAGFLLSSLLLEAYEPTRVQIEQFVVSRRASRSTSSKAGADTRALIVQLVAECADTGAAHVLRPATAVKPWATDDRLDAAGLLAATKGMQHARDASRHALFLACREGGLPDPLSKEFTR